MQRNGSNHTASKYVGYVVFRPFPNCDRLSSAFMVFNQHVEEHLDQVLISQSISFNQRAHCHTEPGRNQITKISAGYEMIQRVTKLCAFLSPHFSLYIHI